MQRHRNRSRWGLVLPCFLLAGGWSSAQAAPPDDGFEMDEGDSEGDFDDADVIEDVVVAAPEEGDTPPEEGPGEDDTEIDPGDGFVIEDISDDPEALEEEFKSADIDAKGKVGTVTGSVHNAKGEPLAGVEVRAGGTHYVAHTGVDGKFVLKLPPGVHTLSFTLDLYKSGELASVGVVQDQTSTQKIELVPLAGVEETVVVKDDLNLEAEGALQERRKESTKVSDGLDAKEIGKSGGGKVSSVAVRIVGATVVKNRYLYVRGLGHRYGNTLLDGARLPSPEPELRTVPLDVMPSAALSAIDVQKTFSPDVPGDFTGGSVQFETRDVPSELLVGLGVTVGFNTITTAQPMIYSLGFAGPDFVAAGNMPRRIPDSYPKDQKIGRGATGPAPLFEELYTPEQIEAQGEALYTETAVRHRDQAQPNFGLKLQLGNGWATNRPGGRFGILFVGGYDSKQQHNDEIIRYNGLAGGELSPTRILDLDSNKSTARVAYNGLLKFQWNVDARNRLALTTLYAREALDETREIHGRARSVNETEDILSTRQRYIMRSILSTQLAGRHQIERASNLEIGWFGSYSQARRDDPAIREMLYRYDVNDERWELDLSKGTVGDQIFLNLVDHTENGALDLAVPFKQWRGLETRVKFGAWVEGKQRGFDARRYFFTAPPALHDQVPPGTGNVIVRSTIGGGAVGDTQPFIVREGTRPQDNYEASQEIIAGFAMLDLPFVRWFKISGGARVEASTIRVKPIDVYAQPDADPDPSLAPVRLVDLDVLPAVALIFSPKLPEKRGDMNIRLSGTQTVGRPEFRELAPFEFRDYVGGFDVQGNRDLVSTKIWNGDLRLEWFPRKNEVLAISGFFKYFDKPIEQVIAARIPFKASFANARLGILGGVEAEFRKSIDFLAPRTKKKARAILRDFSIGANFAYIYSRAYLNPPCYPAGEMPPTDPVTGEPLPGYVEQEGCRPEYQQTTSRDRPMQGVSPWIVNAYVDYDNSESGTNMRVLFNSFGPRIEGVAGLGLPDTYLQPMYMLDLVGSQRLVAFKRNAIGDLRNELSATFELTNILNTIELMTQGRGRENVAYRTRDGMTISVGLQWKY